MSTYEISKSSLLSLKAEILKKRQELGKTRAENETKIQNLKKKSPLDLKNKNVEERQKFDISEEEEDLLKKSRSILEQKALLYQKLSKASSNLTDEQIEHNRRYLVRFDKKSRNADFSDEEPDLYPEEEDDVNFGRYEPPTNRDEEWVEYVDCLGRTRTCMRKDLEYIKSKDKDLESVATERSQNKMSEVREEPKPTASELSEENELLSSDMRREILRQQWEKEEEELRDKSDIHYQDILFNEARTHGVGYYGFSKNEDERLKQQEALKKLRQETKERQQKSQELKATREKQLKARIQAAKNRKRARLGLPPEEEPEPTPEVETPKEVEADVEKEKEDKLREEMRKNHVRPWDKYKEGVKEHYEYTQEEWVDKKRRERLSDFAPPTSYSRYKRKHDKPESSTSKKSHRREDMEESIEAGLKFIREQVEMGQFS